MVLFVCGLRRSLICWSALAAAITGLVLANINSNQISAIEIDFSEEIRRAKDQAEAGAGPTPTESHISEEGIQAKQAEAAQHDANDTAVSQPVPDESPAVLDLSDESTINVSPADDSAPDGAKLEDEKSEDERPEGKAADEGKPSRYAYRQQGRVRRTEGMTVEEKISIGNDTEDQPLAANVRVMKMHEVAHANRLDRLNLFFARLTLSLAVLVVAVDYLRRFNMTFRSLCPLPVGGPLIDSFFPKTRTVCLRAPGKRTWRKLLRRIVHKGETFIYFGEDDPYAASQLGRIPLIPKGVWPLEKITRSADSREFDDEFLFESVWFGRYCFVILDKGGLAADLLGALSDFLHLRHASRASARHTVNVIWNLPAALSEDTLARLAALGPETNFKLLVVTNQPLTEIQKSCFDEII
jgi:hypothetical protein